MTRLNTRTTFLLAAILAGAVIAFWLWRSGSYEPVNLPPRTAGPWVAFGDSLTAGQGAEVGNAYPAILSRQLGVPIRNMGVNGATTGDAMRRLDALIALCPRVVLLCFGGNDALGRVPIDETFSNLDRMIDRLLEQGSFVVLLGIRSASLRDRYASRFKDLARAKRVVLVPDILDDVLGRPNLMSDYVHPNAQGYDVIAKKVAEKLEPFVEKLNAAQ